MKKLYGFPNLPKAGLANMLIPWAECVIWCKDNGVTQIAPFWLKFRLGPYLRGERDKRQYHKLFSSKGRITGFKRLWLFFISCKIDFKYFSSLVDKKQNYRPTIICFSDMNHLEKLIGRHDDVLNELLDITRPEFWPSGLPHNYIGIHIRMGDFPQKGDINSQVYFRQPISWYVEALVTLRKSLNNDLTAVIFSDGSTSDLEEILKIENVFRSPFSNSISDLLAIAKSTILLTSRSSFSLFGAYLGQVPSLWYEGKAKVSGGYLPEETRKNYEIEWMPGQIIPKDFINVVKDRIELKKC